MNTMDAIKAIGHTEKTFVHEDGAELLELSYNPLERQWECAKIHVSDYMRGYTTRTVLEGLPEREWEPSMPQILIGRWYLTPRGNYWKIYSYNDKTGKAIIRKSGRKEDETFTRRLVDFLPLELVNTEQANYFLNYGRESPQHWHNGDIIKINKHYYAVCPEDINGHSDIDLREATLICFAEERRDLIAYEEW